MTSEQRRWTQIRMYAQAYLPSDFAVQVVSRVRNRRKADRREYIVVAVTAALCLFAVAVANWYVGNRIQQNNLARWDIAEAQIKALKTSL